MKQQVTPIQDPHSWNHLSPNDGHRHFAILHTLQLLASHGAMSRHSRNVCESKSFCWTLRAKLKFCCTLTKRLADSSGHAHVSVKSLEYLFGLTNGLFLLDPSSIISIRPYINHISTIYQPYINHISTIYQPYINHISTHHLVLWGSIYQPIPHPHVGISASVRSSEPRPQRTP